MNLLEYIRDHVTRTVKVSRDKSIIFTMFTQNDVRTWEKTAIQSSGAIRLTLVFFCTILKLFFTLLWMQLHDILSQLRCTQEQSRAMLYGVWTWLEYLRKK